MGHRITWRNNPRASYPWPQRTKRYLLSDFEDEWEAGGALASFIGPMDREAVAEFFYRVKSLRVAYSVTISSVAPAPPETRVITGNHPLALASITNETQRFADCSYPGTGSSVVLADPFIYDAPLVEIDVTPIDRNNDLLATDVAHATDTDGFYTAGIADVIDSTSGVGVTLTTSDVFNPALHQFDADLVLASGTHAFRMVATAGTGWTVDSASATFTATEWFPFAHENGSPFWDSTTGEYLAPA
jgi:hypothetical protein